MSSEILLEHFIIKLSYDKEWFQADAVIQFPKLLGEDMSAIWFDGLELLKMLRGTHESVILSQEQNDIVEKAMRISIKKSLSLEQERRREYRESKSLLPIQFFPVKEEDWVKIFPHFK